MGTARYSSSHIKGIIESAEGLIDEKISRRKAKYRHDIIDSFVVAITRYFRK